MKGGDYINHADYKMYQMTFFIGYPFAGCLYIAINKIFPPSGLGISEELPGYGADISSSEIVIDGVAADYDKENIVVKEGAKSVDESV